MPPSSAPLVVPRILSKHTQGPIFFDEEDRTTLSLPFRQAWLPTPEPDFRPGTVLLALDGDTLVVTAVLSDDYITTTTTADQQFLWERGDVFELFLQAHGQPDYHEFQYSPGGHRLQLHYPHATADRTRGLAAYLRPALIGEHAVRVDPSERWQVALRLPLSPLLPPDVPCPRMWSLAACRYDYHRDGTFTLASTARLALPEFHRGADWTRIQFPPSTA